MPSILEQIESEVHGLGLERQSFLIRMTGCPNGCARPYNAEIALVGRAPGAYALFVGGNPEGSRLAEILAEKVPEKAIAGVLRPVLLLYKQERQAGESFGAFCARAGLDRLRSCLPAASSGEKAS